ncbi:hypothetical protein OG535_00375 [Kitasatospora sp. NBC_00085]|uniref:hypothetical protein n=1 Tax=Kitasatospora sp. NBC_00085 TaxID=2903566 RepID=UPI0032483162
MTVRPGLDLGSSCRRFRPASRGEGLAPVRPWTLDNLARRQSVDEPAQGAYMSHRTFIRRFRQETDTSPMAWLTAADGGHGGCRAGAAVDHARHERRVGVAGRDAPRRRS